MPFASGTPYHQGPHFQESRPKAAKSGNHFHDPRVRARKQVLIVDKERLDSGDFACVVLQRKITVVEPLIDRILDDLVLAAIFAVIRKGRRPVRAAFKLSP